MSQRLSNDKKESIKKHVKKSIENLDLIENNINIENKPNGISKFQQKILSKIQDHSIYQQRLTAGIDKSFIGNADFRKKIDKKSKKEIRMTKLNVASDKLSTFLDQFQIEPKELTQEYPLIQDQIQNTDNIRNAYTLVINNINKFQMQKDEILKNDVNLRLKFVRENDPILNYHKIKRRKSSNSFIFNHSLKSHALYNVEFQQHQIDPSKIINNELENVQSIPLDIKFSADRNKSPVHISNNQSLVLSSNDDEKDKNPYINPSPQNLYFKQINFRSHKHPVHHTYRVKLTKTQRRNSIQQQKIKDKLISLEGEHMGSIVNPLRRLSSSSNMPLHDLQTIHQKIADLQDEQEQLNEISTTRKDECRKDIRSRMDNTIQEFYKSQKKKWNVFKMEQQDIGKLSQMDMSFSANIRKLRMKTIILVQMHKQGDNVISQLGKEHFKMKFLDIEYKMYKASLVQVKQVQDLIKKTTGFFNFLKKQEKVKFVKTIFNLENSLIKLHNQITHVFVEKNEDQNNQTDKFNERFINMLNEIIKESMPDQKDNFNYDGFHSDVFMRLSANSTKQELPVPRIDSLQNTYMTQENIDPSSNMYKTRQNSTNQSNKFLQFNKHQYEHTIENYPSQKNKEIDKKKIDFRNISPIKSTSNKKIKFDRNQVTNQITNFKIRHNSKKISRSTDQNNNISKDTFTPKLPQLKIKGNLFLNRKLNLSKSTPHKYLDEQKITKIQVKLK